MFILVIGKVRTMDPRLPEATWFVIQDDRIVSVGQGAPPISGFEAIYNFSGYAIYPGFNDAHSHLMAYGFKLGEIDLKGTGSIPEIADRIAGASLKTPIVRAQGYNQVLLREGRHPTRAELDRMVPDRPLILAHASGHMVVANSRALALAGIDRHTDNPPGGHIERDEHGEPTGLLQENAQNLMVAALPQPTTEEMVKAITRASGVYASWGLTTTQEAGVGWHGPNELAAWQLAREEGKLFTRAVLMPDARTLNWTSQAPFLYQGLRTGFGDVVLRLGPVKIFADGSMIGRTAAMNEPYEGSAERGMLIWEDEKLRAMIQRLHTERWQIAVHAIGDRAVDQVLDAYEFASQGKTLLGSRHRIEHAGVLTDHALDRCRRLGVLPVPQQHFVGELGETFRAAIGDRVQISYRQKSILRAGLVLAGSSDCFVVDGRPLLGIHDAVNQLTAKNRPYAPGEALTPQEALEAYTYGSAYAAKEEKIKGRLQSGMLADFVVLDGDPVDIDQDKIRDIRVVATYMGGRETYRDPKRIES